MTGPPPFPIAPQHLRHACPHCGTPISANASVRPGHCGAKACEDKALKGAIRKRERLKREDFERRVAIIEEALGPDPGPVVPVPHIAAPVAPQDPEAVEAFFAHLDALIEQVFAEDPPEPAPPSEPQEQLPGREMLWAVCGACRGLCCTQGRRHLAFVDATTIRGHRARYPDIDEDGVRAIYRAALPEEAMPDACVFQGALGCTLDRDDRGATCNWFRCEDLARLTKEVVDGDLRPRHLGIFANRTEERGRPGGPSGYSPLVAIEHVDTDGTRRRVMSTDGAFDPDQS